MPEQQGLTDGSMPEILNDRSAGVDRSAGDEGKNPVTVRRVTVRKTQMRMFEIDEAELAEWTGDDEVSDERLAQYIDDSLGEGGNAEYLALDGEVDEDWDYGTEVEHYCAEHKDRGVLALIHGPFSGCCLCEQEQRSPLQEDAPTTKPSPITKNPDQKDGRDE